MKIAFGFKAGSGKDHASEYFCGKYGGVNLKFAGPLKQLCSDIQKFMGFPEVKDRELLQWLGTNYGRARDENVWVRLAENNINRALKSVENIYFSDLRFVNEAEMLKRNGFILVKLDRDKSFLPANESAHPSETALANYNGWDYVVKNCGELSHFEGQLDLLWEKASSGEHNLPYYKTLEIR